MEDKALAGDIGGYARALACLLGGKEQALDLLRGAIEYLEQSPSPLSPPPSPFGSIEVSSASANRIAKIPPVEYLFSLNYFVHFLLFLCHYSIFICV